MKSIPPTLVDRAIERYLERLASVMPPSPTGRQLDNLRAGVVPSGGAGDAVARLIKVIDVGGPMKYCTVPDLAILASRHWARAWMRSREQISLKSGKTLTVDGESRPALVTYAVAADWLGWSVNRYRKRYTEARAKVIRAIVEESERRAA